MTQTSEKYGRRQILSGIDTIKYHTRIKYHTFCVVNSNHRGLNWKGPLKPLHINVETVDIMILRVCIASTQNINWFCCCNVR